MNAFVCYSDPPSETALTDIYETLARDPQAKISDNEEAREDIVGSSEWAGVDLPFGETVFTLDTDPDAPGLPDVPIVRIWANDSLFRLTRPDDELEEHAIAFMDFIEIFYEASIEAGAEPLYVLAPNSTDQEHIDRKPDLIDLSAGDIRNGRLTFLSWIHLLPPHYAEPVDNERLSDAPAWRKRTLSAGAILFAFRPTPHRITDEFIRANEYFGFDG